MFHELTRTRGVPACRTAQSFGHALQQGVAQVAGVVARMAVREVAVTDRPPSPYRIGGHAHDGQQDRQHPGAELLRRTNSGGRHHLECRVVPVQQYRHPALVVQLEGVRAVSQQCAQQLDHPKGFFGRQVTRRDPEGVLDSVEEARSHTAEQEIEERSATGQVGVGNDPDQPRTVRGVSGVRFQEPGHPVGQGIGDRHQKPYRPVPFSRVGAVEPVLEDSLVIRATKPGRRGEHVDEAVAEGWARVQHTGDDAPLGGGGSIQVAQHGQGQMLEVVADVRTGQQCLDLLGEPFRVEIPQVIEHLPKLSTAEQLLLAASEEGDQALFAPKPIASEGVVEEALVEKGQLTAVAYADVF